MRASSFGPQLPLTRLSLTRPTMVRLAVTSLTTLAVLGSSSLVSAQLGSTGGVSQGCLQKLGSALSDNDLASCLHASGLTGQLRGAGTSSSLVPVIESYLNNNLCPMEPCSQSTLSKINGTIKDGCSSELSQPVGDKPNAAQTIVALLSHYDDLRDAVCLEDKNDGDKLCIVESLQAYENATGQPLTISSAMDPLQLTQLSMMEENKTVACNDCNRAVARTLDPFYKSLLNQTGYDAVHQNLTSLCGNDYFSGAMPASIQSSAKDTSTSPNAERTSNTDGAFPALKLASWTAVVAGPVFVGFSLLL